MTIIRTVRQVSR